MSDMYTINEYEILIFIGQKRAPDMPAEVLILVEEAATLQNEAVSHFKKWQELHKEASRKIEEAEDLREKFLKTENSKYFVIIKK